MWPEEGSSSRLRQRRNVALARTARSNHHDDCAARDRKVDAAQHVQATIVLVQCLDAQQRVACGSIVSRYHSRTRNLFEHPVDAERLRIGKDVVDHRNAGEDLQWPVGVGGHHPALRYISSATPMTDRIDVSLNRLTQTLPSAGSTRAIACGSMMRR